MPEQHIIYRAICFDIFRGRITDGTAINALCGVHTAAQKSNKLKGYTRAVSRPHALVAWIFSYASLTDR